MKKLSDLVELVSNTEEAVVLKILPDSELDLICLGCFNGDETMFRLTKGTNMTCTVWVKNGNHYSWHWGEGSHSLVSPEMDKRGEMIQKCIEDDFDILVRGTKQSIKKDMERTLQTHDIILFQPSQYDEKCVCRKDGEFYRYFESMDIAINHFEMLGYTVKLLKQESNVHGSTTYYYLIDKSLPCEIELYRPNIEDEDELEEYVRETLELEYGHKIQSFTLEFDINKVYISDIEWE